MNPNSLINFNVAASTIDNNGSEGLLINVTDSAVVNYRSANNSYSTNGANGKLDGVRVVAIGNGPADSAIARLLFSADTVDNNKGNGFTLDAENGATMICADGSKIPRRKGDRRCPGMIQPQVMEGKARPFQGQPLPQYGQQG